MCGIFGTYSSTSIEISSLRSLARQAKQRGRDSRRLISRKIKQDNYKVLKSYEKITKLFKKEDLTNYDFAVGHSHLVASEPRDNQPFTKHDILVLDNGIVTNVDDLNVADAPPPKCQNIKWYLDFLDLDLEETIKTINQISGKSA